MKTNEYVKYVTEQIVTYVDTPSEQKKVLKQERKESQQPFMYRMFGLLPLAFSLTFKKKDSKKKEKKKGS